jgi:hypothetical protein
VDGCVEHIAALCLAVLEGVERVATEDVVVDAQEQVVGGVLPKAADELAVVRFAVGDDASQQRRRARR